MALLLAGCAQSGPAAEGRAEASETSSDVSAESIERSTEGRLQELLEGRVSGVQVIRRGGGIAVRIRGVSSINGSNEPLYVVDGQPVKPGPGGVLGINPYDVKSIRVLKDASSTSYYGVRGANGVVVVKTK